MNNIRRSTISLFVGEFKDPSQSDPESESGDDMLWCSTAIPSLPDLLSFSNEEKSLEKPLKCESISASTSCSFASAKSVSTFSNDDFSTFPIENCHNYGHDEGHKEAQEVKPRKPCKRVFNPLLKFIDNQDSSKKKPKKGGNNVRTYPKKEYYRIKLIRNYKKSIRKIAQNKFPKEIKTPLSDPMDMIDDSVIHCGDHYRNFVGNNIEHLIKLALVKSGPKTDLLHKIKKSSQDVAPTVESTYNNKYCKAIFDDAVFMKGFEFYVHAIFIDKSAQELCDHFAFLCCNDLIHSESCMEKWGQLKTYSSKNMLGV